MTDKLETYYVTLTWHDFPEGGSFGTLVKAKNHIEAEELARVEMADAYTKDDEVEEEDYLNHLANMVESYWDKWGLIDCWPVEDFILSVRKFEQKED